MEAAAENNGQLRTAAKKMTSKDHYEEYLRLSRIEEEESRLEKESSQGGAPAAPSAQRQFVGLPRLMTPSARASDKEESASDEDETSAGETRATEEESRNKKQKKPHEFDANAAFVFSEPSLLSNVLSHLIPHRRTGTMRLDCKENVNVEYALRAYEYALAVTQISRVRSESHRAIQTEECRVPLLMENIEGLERMDQLGALGCLTQLLLPAYLDAAAIPRDTEIAMESDAHVRALSWCCGFATVYGIRAMSQITSHMSHAVCATVSFVNSLAFKVEPSFIFDCKQAAEDGWVPAFGAIQIGTEFSLSVPVTIEQKNVARDMNRLRDMADRGGRALCAVYSRTDYGSPTLVSIATALLHKLRIKVDSATCHQHLVQFMLSLRDDRAVAMIKDKLAMTLDPVAVLMVCKLPKKQLFLLRGKTLKVHWAFFNRAHDEYSGSDNWNSSVSSSDSESD
jgi:hypothetical protein